MIYLLSLLFDLLMMGALSLWLGVSWRVFAVATVWALGSWVFGMVDRG